MEGDASGRVFGMVKGKVEEQTYSISCFDDPTLISRYSLICCEDNHPPVIFECKQIL